MGTGNLSRVSICEKVSLIWTLVKTTECWNDEGLTVSNVSNTEGQYVAVDDDSYSIKPIAMKRYLVLKIFNNGFFSMSCNNYRFIA